MAESSEQYLRKVSLIVSKANLEGLDLSKMRIKFSVKTSDNYTPNTADIRIYNLSEDTARQIQKEFKQVILQAGYESNYGVIFQGNIKQVLIGRESATETFVDIIAGDGDRAYNFSVVNQTIEAGASFKDQLNAAVKSMTPNGVTLGYVPNLPDIKYPRGKVMFGNTKNYLSDMAESQNLSWSIQQEKLTFVSNTSYLPGEAVLLTARTGLIGAPTQTNEGVNAKCLLNPRMKPGGRVEIDNALVQRIKLNLQQVGTANNIPLPLNNDGIYYILAMEHQGDTRGTEWYTNLICLYLDPSTHPANAVNGG